MTKPITFIHTSDWHIRDMQYGRSFRGADFAKAAHQVVDIAISNKVDFILNGGDTFQINRPSGPMLDLLFKIHMRLRAAGIPMYTVTGNHDMAAPSYLEFPGYSEDSLGQGRGGVICIDNKIIDHDGIRIAGFSGVDWREVVPVIQSWKDPVDIICWHGAVEEFVPFPMDTAWSMLLMPQKVCKAWLLGDIHLPGRQRMEDGTLVAYPGPIELCERGEPARKKIDHYTLADGWRNAPFPEPVELELLTRPVVFLTVNDDKEADQALSRVREALLANPDCPPMVFMSFARAMKTSVVRIREALDLRTTVFRAAPKGCAYEATPHSAALDAEGRPLGRVSLPAVIDQVVAPGTPLNAIAQILGDKDADVRYQLTRWVDQQQLPEGAAIDAAQSPAAPLF